MKIYSSDVLNNSKVEEFLNAKNINDIFVLIMKYISKSRMSTANAKTLDNSQHFQNLYTKIEDLEKKIKTLQESNNELITLVNNLKNTL